MTQAANARQGKRRGQAALEYLTTYGFALLAMLITIGAISYLGFFNPNVLRANECSFPSGIVCEDYQITDGVNPPVVQVILRNQYGVNLTVENDNTTMRLDPGLPGVYACDNPIPLLWEVGTTKMFTCALNPSEYVSGQRYDATISMNFTQENGQYRHRIIGVVSTTAK